MIMKLGSGKARPCTRERERERRKKATVKRPFVVHWSRVGRPFIDSYLGEREGALIDDIIPDHLLFSIH